MVATWRRKDESASRSPASFHRPDHANAPPRSRSRHEPGPGRRSGHAISSSFFRPDDRRVLSQGAVLLAPTHEPRRTEGPAPEPPSPVASAPFARGHALPKMRALPRALHAERRSSPIVSPGPARTGEGSPPRWSSTSRQAPIGSRRRPTPRSFPAGPRRPRTEPPSRRAAEETGAIGRAERRGQGGARSDRDARPLEKRPRPETSPDPRYRCTDDPRRPPPPGTNDRDGEPPARARPRREGPRRLDRPTRRLGSRADPPSPLLAKSSVAPAARAGGGGGAGPPADRPPDARKGCRSRTAPPLQARVRPLEGRGLALGPWGLADRGQPPGERLPGCTCSTSRIGEDPAPLRGPSPWPRPDQRLERPIAFDRIDSRTRSPRPRTFVPHRFFRWDLIEIKSSFSDLV